MLSASWERAAKPGAPPTTGAPHPPAGRQLSSSSELGVCLTIKATTFYSVCTEPKQTTVYRLLFSFLFEMRRFGVLSLPRGLSPVLPPTVAPAHRPEVPPQPHPHSSRRPVEEWGRGQELVSTRATREQCGPSGGLLCMWLFLTQ